MPSKPGSDEDNLFTPPPPMSERPTAEEAVERWKWIQKTLTQIEKKLKELYDARATFLQEQKITAQYLQANFPSKYKELTELIMKRKGIVARKRPDRIKARPTIDKEIFAVIKAWPDSLSKEEVAVKVVELYDRELREVTDTMKTLFRTGEISERNGRVSLGPGGI